jgi:hypothetical protein
MSSRTRRALLSLVVVVVASVAALGGVPRPPVASAADAPAGVVDQDGPPVGGTVDSGYLMAADDGEVLGFGVAAVGSAQDFRLSHPVVDIAGTPSGAGYWLVGSDGGIFTFGDARYHGSTGNIALNQPIVGMAATESGRGYWLVASDGGIFTFGDARFFGSTGSLHLNQPIVGMAATPSGQGYWLVAADGGIFTFGDARFLGSTGAIHLARPIVGMAATPSGRGYWMVASDGGIFTFGDAVFYGSAAAAVHDRPVVGMAATPTGLGYWLATADATVFPYGDATSKGPTSSAKLDGRIVGLLPQGGDVRAPVLHQLSFGPTRVDTSTAPATITVRARITDDFSGHAGTTVIFKSPSGTLAQAFFDGGNRISGDGLDGIYQGNVVLPANSPTGQWKITDFQMTDAVGNMADVDGRTLAQAGYATTFDQVGAGDSDHPHLRALSVSPATIDTSAGPATVTVTARITDDRSGVDMSGVQIRFGVGEPGTGGQVHDVVFWSAQPLSGDSRDGVWQTTFTMPAASAPGRWAFQNALLTDSAKNSGYDFPGDLPAPDSTAGFTQTGAGDTTPPQLRSLDISPRLVDTSQQAATLTVTARITDAGVGVAATPGDSTGNDAWFVSPSGQQVLAAFAPWTVVSGDRHDATYRTTATVPLHSEQGTWTLKRFDLGDLIGNHAGLTTGDLAAAGYPTSFEVLRTVTP